MPIYKCYFHTNILCGCTYLLADQALLKAVCCLAHWVVHPSSSCCSQALPAPALPALPAAHPIEKQSREEKSVSQNCMSESKFFENWLWAVEMYEPRQRFRQKVWRWLHWSPEPRPVAPWCHASGRQSYQRPWTLIERKTQVCTFSAETKTNILLVFINTKEVYLKVFTNM